MMEKWGALSGNRSGDKTRFSVLIDKFRETLYISYYILSWLETGLQANI